MESIPSLQQVEFIHLSRDIQHTKYSELCLALGFSFNLNQSILKKHQNDYIGAMVEILNDWNNEHGDKHKSRSLLVTKLQEVKLTEFGKKLSKGEYLLKRQDPHEQKATPLPSSSDIYSEKISESLTVQQCREKLKNKYLNQLCKIQMKPWDKNDYAEFKDMHTDVTMVKKDANGKDTKKKEILQGSVAKIFSTKVNGVLPARILISAPAGRGKTTAVAKMAYDWAHRERGSALEHLPLLFVVKFRITSQLTSIGEAIKSQLLSDVDDLTSKGLESFIRKNQGICHIILDGLDEYAGISSSQRSSGITIVSVILWEEFPECRVLVTTRPHLDKFFDQDDLPRVYTKMWIEGFSQKSSREYIDRFFASTSNPSKRQSLKDYIDEQPLIKELVKTPLFCLMICHLWSEGLLDSDTTTQTELLDSVNVFLMQYSNAKSKSRVKITRKQLSKIISQLGKVALNGLLDDAKKLVFTPHDFRKDPSNLDMACELGIVSKTTVSSTRLPQSNETSYTTIEFYHKLAQEHSAGKFLADQTTHLLLRFKVSKLDTVLREIKANIGDYENLIRFAAGTDNKLCIRIMEVVLANSFLDESERYRILLDCSSETKGTEGNVSSLVQRCVNAQCIVLKAPTVYTVVGMQNLPKQLKREVKTVRFEGSTLTTDVTSRLWSCLKSFSMLHTLNISDSSLSFPSSPPELPSVTKLSAERVTSQSYEEVLSLLPGVREIDVSINAAETSNDFQITSASRPMGQTRARDVHIRLHAWPALTTDRKIDSGESIGGLSLLFRDQTRHHQRLHVSGVKGTDEEALVDLFVKTKQLTSLNSGSGGGSLSDTDAVTDTRFEIQKCHLSTEMTEKLWSCLRFFPSLNQLTISDSSLSFPSSPPELPSVTKLSAERVTSQSYERVLSSVPGVREIDVFIDVPETSSTSQITTASRPMGQTTARDEQFFVHIRLHTWPALTTDRKIESGESIGGLSLLFGDQTRNQQQLHVFGVKGRDEKTLVDLFVKTKQLTSLNSGSGGGSLSDTDAVLDTRFEIQKCHLSTEMTETLWSCLRSFPSLNQLTISDSSLGFPSSPPELPSVKKLLAERVTSESYEGLLSSLPGLEEVDITIGDANTEYISQIHTSLHRHLTGQDLTRINLHSFPPDGNVSSMLRKRVRGLGFLITECQAILSGVVFGLGGALIDVVQSSTRLMSASLYFEQFYSSLSNSDTQVLNIDTFKIKDCQLSTEMTERLWSYLRSFTSLTQLSISDSSLSFSPSPPELLSVTKLSAERVTSQSYEGVLLSVPGVKDIDVSIVVTGTSNTFQISTASRPITQTRARDEQFFVHIRLQAWPALSTDRNIDSSESNGGFSLLFRDQTKNQQLLHVSGVKGRDEEALVDLFVKTKQLTSLNSGSEGGSLNNADAAQNTRLEIQQCQLSTEMTEKLWSFLRSFTLLNQLSISDSSLSFPPSPSELPSVTKLSAERVTSESYAGVLSSVPCVREIDVSIDVAETRDIFQIPTASRPLGQTRDAVHIKLQAWSGDTPVRKIETGDMIGGLTLVIGDQTKNHQRLAVSGVEGRDEEALVGLFVKTKKLKSLNLGSGGSFPNDDSYAVQNTRLEIQYSQLSTEMTEQLWSCLRSLTSLNQLTISDSSLSFPPSSLELPSIKKLLAERVTSQSYEGLLSSLPGLEEVDITIGDANTEYISQIHTSLHRHLTGQDLTRINLHSFPPDGNVSSVLRKRMRGLGFLITECQAILSGVVFGLGGALIDVLQSSTRLMSASLYFEQFCRSLSSDKRASNIDTLKIKDCQLSTEMTEKLWSCLRSFTSLTQLSISDSSLSFPPSLPELLSVKKLSAERLTSQSYEGVLSSVPGVRDIDVSIRVADTSNTFQITAASRPMGQTRARDEQFFVRLHAWPALTTDRKIDSGESFGGLSLLVRDQTRNQQRLHVSGVKDRDEEALIDLFSKTKQLTSLNSGNGCGSLSNTDAVKNTRLEIQQCQLSTKMTEKLWSLLRSFTSLNELSISDSSINFPPSPPELTSVTKLSAERVTSQSYAGVLKSVPFVREIDASIVVADTRNIFQITTASRPMGQTRDAVHIKLQAWSGDTPGRNIKTGDMIGGISLVIGDQTKNQQRLNVSGVKGRDEESLVDLFVKTKQLNSLNSGSVGSSLNNDRYAVQNTRLEIQYSQLSTEMTEKLWSCLRSLTALNQLTISDSSLSFPPSPLELLSVKKLLAERVTSQSYADLLSSLPGLEEINITIGDANTEDISQIKTSLRRHLTGQDLTRINPHSFTSEMNVSRMLRKRTRGLGLLITECQATLSGIVFGPKETLIDLIQSSTYLMSASLYVEQFSRSLNSDQDALHIKMWTIKDCQLSTEMTVKLWSCLRFFTSLNQLTISDSSLSFSLSPPELLSVTTLSAERVTSQNYEGLLTSLPGLRDIDVTIDDAERDIPQITACLRRTGGQQLTCMNITAPLSDKNSVSRETMRELSLLIREQTKNLWRLGLYGIKCLDEEDLVELVESAAYLKSLDSLHLQSLNRGSFDYDRQLDFQGGQLRVEKYQLSSEMTARLWSCLRSFTSLKQLTILDSSFSFPPSPPELPSVKKLSAAKLTSQSYEGLLSSLPGLTDIDITIDDAESDIHHITAGLRRTGGQRLTNIRLTAPSSLPSEKKSVSRETMRELGLLIREQTNNLQSLELSTVKCTVEEDLVFVIECCRRVKTMSTISLDCCGTSENGQLRSRFPRRRHTLRGNLSLRLLHDDTNWGSQLGDGSHTTRITHTA